MIPYGHQYITEADIQAVVDVLRSDFITQGPAVPAFEKVVSQYCGANHAVAVNSATSALHIACLALGLGPGDRMWTSPNSFVATANCAIYCGSKVDFVDIDPCTYNMSVEFLEQKLVSADLDGTLPKVVIPVHFAGQSCDMKTIRALADQYGFHIIEDASHSIGGKYCTEPVGNCRYSDITIFSFHPVKIITTAEGGMALTNDQDIASRMQRLRSHGIVRNSTEMAAESNGPWYYQQIELGYNYRMTDIQAALGKSQMQRLDEFVKRRHQIRKIYDDNLVDLPVLVPWQHPDAYSAFHLYPIRLNSNANMLNRKQVFEKLRSSGIGVNVHYIPIHTQPYYKQLGFEEGDYPNAEQYYRESISLPMYPGLENNELRTITNVLRDILT